MASSPHRHRRRHSRWPVLGFGFGGITAAAAVIALVVGVSQAAGTRACAAAFSAGQAQQAGEVEGTATHYVLQGLPNCSYPSPPADGLFVALSPAEYGNAAACGGYLEVHGPGGSVRVEVVDQCPDCAAGHIDLSEAAFSAIAPLEQGQVDVTYQPLADPSLPGPVSLLVKQGSSPYWLALLVMNTGNALTSVQVKSASGGSWHSLVQASYNYWVAQSGAGAGPFTVRLADSQGHVVTLPGVALSPGAVQHTGTLMYGASTAAADPTSTESAARRASRPATTATSGRATSSRAADAATAGPEPSRRPAASPSAVSTC